MPDPIETRADPWSRRTKRSSAPRPKPSMLTQIPLKVRVATPQEASNLCFASKPASMQIGLLPPDDQHMFFVDGTLLVGTYDERLDCFWAVARDGAGLVRIAAGRIILEWLLEPITMAVYDANVVEPVLPDFLPLFPDLDR